MGSRVIVGDFIGLRPVVIYQLSFLQKISQDILYQFRAQLFSRVLKWPAETYQKRNSGTVVSVFINQAGTALGAAAELIATIFRDSLQIVALLCVLFYHNWQLSLVSFVVAPFWH